MYDRSLNWYLAWVGCCCAVSILGSVDLQHLQAFSAWMRENGGITTLLFPFLYVPSAG